MIHVTKTYLPSQEKYQSYVERIWRSNIVTNNGQFLRELESRLESYLDAENLSVVSNGTIAIQIAIKALNLKGEIITTPFSYVATTSSIVWENCTAVFSDINEQSWCIDPTSVEQKINDDTCAILATHVFGNPCDVMALEAISKKYDIPIIYDAAHAFGVKYNSKNILAWGDINTLSFHATKVFHTVEGGAIICRDATVQDKVNYLRNFGHKGKLDFQCIGINGKNAGFYSFNFANLGCHVKSFEKSSRYSKYAKSITEEKNLNVKWHQETFDPNKLNDLDVDLTLMLSVYQWMAEGGDKMEYASSALRKVSSRSRYLIFELGFNKGKSHIKTKRLNHYGALIDLLRENSEYTNFKLLGKTRLWRHYSRFLVLCSKDEKVIDTGFRKWLSDFRI